MFYKNFDHSEAFFDHSEENGLTFCNHIDIINKKRIGVIKCLKT